MKKCQTPDSVLSVKCKMLSPGRGREHVVGCRLRREPYLFIFLFHFFFLIFQKHGHRLMLSRTEWELHPQPPGYKLICWSHSWCKVMLHLWKRLLLAFLINLNYPKQWSQFKYLVCNIFKCNHKRCPDQLWLLVRSCKYWVLKDTNPGPSLKFNFKIKLQTAGF